MSDDLCQLRNKIERLVDAVADVRDRLLNCVQVCSRPEDSLALARGIAETLTKRILVQVELDPPAMLDACLRALERPDQTSRGLVPPEIISLIHMVRVIGNKAIHGSMQIQASPGDVALVLQSLLRIVEWHSSEFVCGPRLREIYGPAVRSPGAARGVRSSAVVLIDASLDPHDSPYEQLIKDGMRVIRPKFVVSGEGDGPPLEPPLEVN